MSQVMPEIERRALARPQLVLIVDDSPDLRELWRLWLTIWGFRVEEAENGLDGVRKTQALKPALVLMDIWMPVMDGVRATQRLKADAATAAVPVLAMSADTLPPAPQQALEAGCEGFLAKPIDAADLLDAIRLAFRGVRGRCAPPVADTPH